MLQSGVAQVYLPHLPDVLQDILKLLEYTYTAAPATDRITTDVV